MESTATAPQKVFFIDEMKRFSTLLLQIFEVVGLDAATRDQLALKFFLIVESKAISRILNRVPDEVKSDANRAIDQLSNGNDPALFNQNSKVLRDIIKSSLPAQEVQLIYKECVLDLFDEYFRTVAPSMSDLEKAEIEALLSRYT